MGLTNTIIDKTNLCPLCNQEFFPKGKYKSIPEDKQVIHWQSKDISDRCNIWKLGERVIICDGMLKFEATGNDIWSGCSRCYNCEESMDALIFIRDGIIDEIRPIQMKCPKCGSGGDISVGNDENHDYFIHFWCFKCDHESNKKIIDK